MDVLKAIEERRTIRRFSEPPTNEQLQRILRAGAYAPSAGNRQAWFVVIINDPKTMEKLGEIKKTQNAAFTPNTEKGRAQLQVQKEAFSSCISLMFYTYASEPDDDHRYDMGSVWLFVENLCLAALPEGLGTQIVAFWDEWEKEINQLLGVPDKYKQATCVNIGVPDPAYEPPAKVLKPESKWIFQERWPQE